jgi:hypothetical protein
LSEIRRLTRYTINIIKDFKKSYPDTPATFNTFRPVDQSYLAQIESLGVKAVIHDRMDLSLNLIKGDVVVLNTAAYTAELKQSVLKALDENQIKKIIWYIHEDWPQQSKL